MRWIDLDRVNKAIEQSGDTSAPDGRENIRIHSDTLEEKDIVITELMRIFDVSAKEFYAEEFYRGMDRWVQRTRRCLMKGFDVMIITEMREFENVIHHEAVKYFNAHRDVQISEVDVFTVWSCKTLQNYKALVSTDIAGDTTYFEFTFNGDRQQLYMDVYIKEKNECIE